MAKKEKDELQKEQFPAQQGAPEVEAVKRSPDSPAGADESRFYKSYVVQNNPMNRDSWTPDHLHEANFSGLTQEAINNGLHPKEDFRFDGAELQEDGRSLRLDYSVGVVPASTDTDAASTINPAMAAKLASKATTPDMTPIQAAKAGAAAKEGAK